MKPPNLRPWRFYTGYERMSGKRPAWFWGKCYWYANWDMCLMVPIPFNFVVKWSVSGLRRLREGSRAIWEAAYLAGQEKGRSDCGKNYQMGYQDGRRDCADEALAAFDDRIGGRRMG